MEDKMLLLIVAVIAMIVGMAICEGYHKWDGRYQRAHVVAPKDDASTTHGRTDSW